MWATIGIYAVAIVGLFIFIYERSKTRQLQAQQKQLKLENEREKIRFQEFEAAYNSNLLKEAQLKEALFQNEKRKTSLEKDIENQVNNLERLKISYQTAQEEFEEKYKSEQQYWIQERQQEYLEAQRDFAEQFKNENAKRLAAAQKLLDELNQLKSSFAAATEIAKRHAEEEDFIKFHSLRLTEQQLREIEQIETIIPTISAEASDAIAKIIWKVYYEKPYTDLVGRVIGNGRHTGIYLITNSKTKMCYVGQAVDVADRWRQHIKRALNAEPRTQNKLYPAMYKEGLENFTFELIEECPAYKLNELEDYWQDFYKAKEYGYSMK